MNLVYDSPNGHISELAVRSQIKKVLESTKNFEMDKKTLRRIIDNLKSDGLVKTKDFQVQIKAAGGPEAGIEVPDVLMLKTLLLTPDCVMTDAELMQDNPTISNPTNKKVTDFEKMEIVGDTSA